MTISANASTMTNITHCYLATEVERISTQHLEETEDLTVHLLDEEEVKALLLNDEVKQSLMAELYSKYKAYYGYAFFIAKKIHPFQS
jgi:ADP-ribose pyrophosphatase